MTTSQTHSSWPAWPTVMAVSAMAGGLGWGIRGQYGHETGAMMAGLLVGLTLALLFCRDWPALSAARAVALMTVAIGFGGSMTYGQTIGLTKDPPFVGNWEVLNWAMLGLAIKGALWIGFGGAFLGMGLSGVRYRPLEMLGIFAGMILLMFVGVWVWNEPFDPARKILPRIYFSADWRWQPDAVLKPRWENWGGLLFSLIGLVVYLAIARRDFLAVRLAGWAVLGGAIGFPLGEAVQAFHAWNPELFRDGLAARIDPVINWWNMMETTFGATFGAVLGLGVWRNRRALATPPAAEISSAWAKPVVEGILLLAYVPSLICWEFFDVPWFNELAESGIAMGLLPAIAIVAGRWWPHAVMLPLTLIPIAGKTLRRLSYEEHVMAPIFGWVIYVVLPLTLAVGAAMVFVRRGPSVPAGRSFLRGALLFNLWLYFGLNFAFFRFPWPWEKWTTRTPNAVIYLVCAIGLTWLAIRKGTGGRGTPAESERGL